MAVFYLFRVTFSILNVPHGTIYSSIKTCKQQKNIFEDPFVGKKIYWPVQKNSHK